MALSPSFMAFEWLPATPNLIGLMTATCHFRHWIDLAHRSEWESTVLNLSPNHPPLWLKPAVDLATTHVPPKEGCR